ncbi:MAG: hypothetical protein ACXAC2_00425 [Candidatus Kariarchaeaceae archaeon]
MEHEHNWIFTKRRYYRFCTIEYYHCYCGLLWNQVLPPLEKPEKASLEDLRRMIAEKKVKVIKPEPETN